MANVYLHYVLDMWFDKVAVKNARGDCGMVRYADDFVCWFQYKEDAEKFYEELKERLAKFGLELSEEKSQTIKFGRFAGEEAGKFDFSGFTVVTGINRKGKYVPKYRTSEKKLKSKRKKAKRWIRMNMHSPVGSLIDKLNVKLRGHYNYYGLSHNLRQMTGFYKYVRYELFKALKRRSNDSKMNWVTFEKILGYCPLLKPKITVPLW